MKPALQGESRSDNHGDGDRDDERMPEREEQPGRDRPFAFLHELAHHIVDGGDVIGIDGVAQSQHISEHCGAEKRRMT